MPMPSLRPELNNTLHKPSLRLHNNNPWTESISRIYYLASLWLTAMTPSINSHLTHSDTIVLQNLSQDIQQGLQPPPPESNTRTPNNNDDQAAIEHLRALNDPTNPAFEPSIFSLFDETSLPLWIQTTILPPYCHLATKIVRHPTDIVFLTHILWNFLLTLPSALYLFLGTFTYAHGILHAVHAVWCAGPFTLVLHNHIHNSGVLAREWRWVDWAFPYVVEPLLGHSWDSYFYHHVKHHHVEANGPNDLSSTIRYQRDSLLHFLHYEARFLFLIWLELPLWFLGKGQAKMAFRVFASEMAYCAFLYYMTVHVNTRASIFVFLLPFFFLRVALMVGNWGQHALVDDLEPDSDLRSSITLIDVPSNRYCFNDGWHTSHHLNPRRHWRDHHIHFLHNKELYATGNALIFRDIDYFGMTITLLSKNYMYLAERLVPIGDQVGMTKGEIAEMLRRKTRRFSEEEIRVRFR